MPHPFRAHLDAMGIPVWVRRGGTPPAEQAEVRGEVPGTTPETGTSAEAAEPLATQVLQARSAQVQAFQVPASQAQNPTARTPAAQALEALEALDAEVRACRKCALHRTRRQTVFGVGSPGAACMVVGEAPGAEEDARGEPFVGRAGKLLDAMLAAIGLGRDDVYIANIVKCRPPRNRDPHVEEATTCSGYLKRQIEAVSPRLLVAAGKVAAQSLLSTTQPIGKLRGQVHQYGGAGGLPVLVTYHPAYYLRSPLEKRKAWDDLVRLRSMLAEGAMSAP